MKRIATLAMVTALLAGTGIAGADIIGFSDVVDFNNIRTGTQLDLGLHDADRGVWQIWNDNIYVETDPSCTSQKVYKMDATEQVSEMHAVFTHVEQHGVSRTKVDLGVSRTDVRSGKISIYTADTETEVPVMEYLGNGKIEMFGQLVDDVSYQDVWANDCTLGEDRRQTLKMFFNFEDWTMDAELITREGGDVVVREYGPYPMIDALALEGVQEIRFYMPGGAGEMLVDGMICNQAFEPAESETGSRNSSWQR